MVRTVLGISHLRGRVPYWENHLIPTKIMKMEIQNLNKLIPNHHPTPNKVHDIMTPLSLQNIHTHNAGTISI